MRAHRIRALKTEMVTFRNRAESISGFLALPERRERHGGIIALHEWWGLNDWVKLQARNLAANGYVVIAVDLYRGKVTDTSSEARKLKRALPENRAIRDMKAAFRYLAARPDVDPTNIGSIGWSMGGGFAIRLAIHEPRLAAAVVNYGMPPTNPIEIQKINAQVLGHWGALDRGIPVGKVRVSAADAWCRTLSFWTKVIKSKNRKLDCGGTATREGSRRAKSDMSRLVSDDKMRSQGACCKSILVSAVRIVSDGVLSIIETSRLTGGNLLAMRSTTAVVKRFLAGVSLLGTMSLGTLPSHPCETIEKSTVTARQLTASSRAGTAELFSRLIERHHWQEAHLVQFSVVRTYSVQNDKEMKLAEDVVAMKYSAPGTEMFTIRSEKGSGFIRHHVFQRLMKDEENRVRADKDPDSLIAPENYTLEIIGKDRIGDANCSVIHAIPKREETDLFEGKIWVDEQDFAIVKIAGHLTKSPSFWIKRVDFVRQYQKIDGFWLLLREEASTNVRIYGKEILTIDYQGYTVTGTEAVLPPSS